MPGTLHARGRERLMCSTAPCLPAAVNARLRVHLAASRWQLGPNASDAWDLLLRRQLSQGAALMPHFLLKGSEELGNVQGISTKLSTSFGPD